MLLCFRFFRIFFEGKRMNQHYDRLAEILIEIQRKDTSHFEELYDLTKKTVYFELQNVGVPSQSIEDLIQEVYIKLLSKANSIDNPQALFKWLKTVSYTSGIDYVKSAVNRREYLVVEEGEDIFEDGRSLTAPIPMPEDIVENKESQKLVYDMIMHLPKNQYRIFIAYYYNEESIKDIASSMGISESSVKTQLFRGRKTIETEVKDLEKKHHIKLYAVLPLPIFLLLFNQKVSAQVLPREAESAVKKILNQISDESLIPKSDAISTASSIASKSTGLGLGAKLGIIITVSIIGIGTIIGVTTFLKLEPPNDDISNEITEISKEDENITSCDFMDENGFKTGYENLGYVLDFLACYDFNYDKDITEFTHSQWDSFCNALLANSFFDYTSISDNMREPWNIPVSDTFMEEFCYMVTGHQIPYDSDIFNEKYVDSQNSFIISSSPYLFDSYEDNIIIKQVDNDTWEVQYDYIYANSSLDNLDGKKSVKALIKRNPDGGIDGYSVYELSVTANNPPTMKDY